MDYQLIKGEYVIEIPYNLLILSDYDYKFMFKFSGFTNADDEHSLKLNGACGVFSIDYKDDEITTDIKTDLVFGNLYEFYNSFCVCFQSLSGTVRLCDYSQKNIIIDFVFDNNSYVIVKVFCKTRLTKADISFEIKTEQSYLISFKENMEKLLYIAENLQGSKDFY